MLVLRTGALGLVPAQLAHEEDVGVPVEAVAPAHLGRARVGRVARAEARIRRERYQLLTGMADPP